MMLPVGFEQEDQKDQRPSDLEENLTEEEKERYKAIKIDHIVFARKEVKGLHYNLSV